MLIDMDAIAAKTDALIAANEAFTVAERVNFILPSARGNKAMQKYLKAIKQATSQRAEDVESLHKMLDEACTHLGLEVVRTTGDMARVMGW